MNNATVQVGPSEKTDANRYIVRAKLGGTFGANDIKLLKAWADGLNSTVKKFRDESKEPVAVLLDISTFEAYTSGEIISVLSELMKNDSPFIYRTATFGGSTMDEMIAQVIESMAGRNNLKNFKTEKEAVAWLKE